MMLVFPVVLEPCITIPRLVGKSDEKCSRISLNSHFLPTKHLGKAIGAFGTSKNKGLKSCVRFVDERASNELPANKIVKSLKQINKIKWKNS